MIALRSAHRRFGLSAAESGFILSMNDIINMVLVLIIGYSAKSFSKPRLLGETQHASWEQGTRGGREGEKERGRQTERERQRENQNLGG